MLNNINLRELSEISGPERAFLSIYYNDKNFLNTLNKYESKIKFLLKNDQVELEHFSENMTMARQWFEENKNQLSSPHCLFISWAQDYVKSFELPVPIRKELIWAGTGPYVRPIAEMQDEYENFLIVLINNRSAKIIHVISAVETDEDKIKGDVKNSVKKGGWSQKRYSRRRHNQLVHYTKEINEKLIEISGSVNISRIILLGSQESLVELENALSRQILDKVAGKKIIDTNAPQEEIMDEAYNIYFEEERKSEQELWNQIKTEYMSGDLAVTGAEDVLKAAVEGRIDSMIVSRNTKLLGSRCRECENLHYSSPGRCSFCGSDSLFEIDLINAIVKQIELSSGYVDFVEDIPELDEMDGVAALLRY